MKNKRIPKNLHFIWVGDESKRPDNCIQSWIDYHPDWTIKLWGNDDLATRSWINAKHMRAMSRHELNGVADMMRWEILYAEGGIVIDADSICIRKLDDDLLDCQAFACWENEIARPGLIAAGYFGSIPENPFIGQIIEDISKELDVTTDMAWKTVGPLRLTDSYRRYQYQDLNIYPSHYFIPEHFSGVVYKGAGRIYARQLWGSTTRSYDDIKKINIKDFSINNSNTASGIPKSSSSGEDSLEVKGTESNENIARKKFIRGHDPYFVQNVSVSNEFSNIDRVELFKSLCQGQKVLHVGCADWPITDVNRSLHIALDSVCEVLDGQDIYAHDLDALRPYVKGRLATDFANFEGPYDIVLVPEVLEHVPNIEMFLESLDHLNARNFLITVPDAYQCRERHFDYDHGALDFAEIVHPDHNCWFSPYTFANVIRKYTTWNIHGIWFINKMSLMMLASRQLS